MINRHHVAVLDLARRRVLIQPSRSQPLPVVTTNSRARIGEWLPRWLSERGVHGSLGWSWLGRADATLTACDWLVVATHTSRDTGDTPPFPLRWQDCAQAGDEADVYPRLALHVIRTALDYPGVFGAYADPRIWSAVSSLVAGAVNRQHVSKVTPTRLVAAYRQRAAANDEQWMFVKGTLERASNERDVLNRLQLVTPAACPRVLAEDAASGLQLLEDAGPPLGPILARDPLERVIISFADLQYHWAMAGEAVPSSVPAIDCDQLWSMIANFLCLGDAEPESVRVIHAAARRAFDRLQDAGYPLSLIHIDPTIANIRLGARGVRFIDFDHAVIAPAALGCELLLARLEHANASWPESLSSHLRTVFAERWHALHPRYRVRAHEDGIRLLAQTMVAAVHWKVLCERIERGEWAGPVDLVWAKGIRRLAARLAEGSAVAVRGIRGGLGSLALS
jgi:hypothetical protein